MVAPFQYVLKKSRHIAILSGDGPWEAKEEKKPLLIIQSKPVHLMAPTNISASTCLLSFRRDNGKHTGELGVTTMAGEGSSPLRVTDLERTLIDIAVRPTYSGGVEEVLNAYRRTNGKASTKRLAKMLSRLDYVYPYHQAIGFYLERSGVYGEATIKVFAKMPMEFDFYLTHQMNEVRHCDRWRVNYPSSLDAD